MTTGYKEKGEVEFCIGLVAVVVLLLVSLYFLLYLVYRLARVFRGRPKADTEVEKNEPRDDLA